MYIDVYCQVTYDTLGRLTEWRRTLTSDQPDVVVVNYSYDVDNNVISVNRTDVSATWYRPDDVTGDEDDEGLVMVRRGGERLEWNSVGQLTGVVSSQLNSTYVYDAVGRLTTVVVNGLTSPSIHLFYSDLDYPERLTHIYQPMTDSVIEYFYDELDGHLHAARINARVMLYIAVDPHGSPICVFNETGHVLRQMSYTPVGAVRQDIVDSRQTPTPWYIGYRAAFHDVTTGLLFLDSRVLDTDNGRWLSPNYQSFIDRRSHSLTSFIRNSDPRETNFLRHGDVIPRSPPMLSESHAFHYTLGYRHFTP